MFVVKVNLLLLCAVRHVHISWRWAVTTNVELMSSGVGTLAGASPWAGGVMGLKIVQTVQTKKTVRRAMHVCLRVRQEVSVSNVQFSVTVQRIVGMEVMKKAVTGQKSLARTPQGVPKRILFTS